MNKTSNLPLTSTNTTQQDIPYLRPVIDQIESEVASHETFNNLSKIPEALKSRNKSS
jgi:hypothetical protein